MKGCAHLNDSWLQGRIKARILQPVSAGTCAPTDIPSQVNEEARPTISIKKDADIPPGEINGAMFLVKGQKEDTLGVKKSCRPIIFDWKR